MKRKKIMSGAALALAGVLVFQSVNWFGFSTRAADDNSESTDDSTYIGNLSSYDLSDVDVTDEYLTNAEDKDIEYLLSLDSDRLLAGFRETAGVDTKGAARYGGWENSLIGGHTMGHYLTAVAQAVASLPDSDVRKQELEQKLNYIIDGLAECQTKLGTGFIFGATVIDKNNVEKQFDNVEQGLTNISTQAWVPWYTMHKILAGLVDIYKYTGNQTALQVAEKLGDWVYARVSGWNEATKSRVLGIEYGGMNDCLYELYSVTGKDNYAVAAHAFDEDSLFELINAGGANALNNRHANTTIPKFLGALNRYITTNGKTVNGETVDASKYLEYAESFFDMVLENHTYITGDNSEWEHFGADNILDAERTNCNCETCNAYNMLKLAKALYMITGNSKYSDYYENTFYNTILSSQNPETGMTTYFQPMASGYFKVYGTETESFWCCTGSGMENFTKLGNAIYYYNNDMVIVSQYFSSVLTDSSKNVKITQTANIPEGDTVKFTINTIDGSEDISQKLAFRLPGWLASDASVKVNGTEVSASVESGYAIIEGLKNNDEIEVTLPMEIKAYNLPDGESVYGFKYGPVVLSAKLGNKDMTQTTTGVSVSIPASKIIEDSYISDGSETVSVINGTVQEFMENINSNLIKTEGELQWTLENTDANLIFVPHYSQYTERYGIYFNYVSNSSAVNTAKYVRDKAQKRFENALIDTVQPGYGQYENDELHQMQDNGSTGETSGGTSRYANAGGSFTYTMKVEKGEDNVLQTDFKKEDNGKTIKISVGDEIVYEETLSYDGEDDEYTVRIAVPSDVIDNAVYDKAVAQGEENTEETYSVADVKFESGDGNPSARICNFLYTTKSYSTDTKLELTSSVGKIEKDGNTYTVNVPEDADSVDLNAGLATEYGYIRIDGIVTSETAPKTVDLTENNYVTLQYTVYAEDHETTEEYTVNVVKENDLSKRENVDKSLAYFVNCGDYDVTTLSEGDLFGIYNGVTDMAYGKDPVTGYEWGIVDTISEPLKNGKADNAAAMTNAVFTDNTWPFETDASVTDSSPKTATNRYTKNQYETGMARTLNYDFELPNGEYEIALYFTDPWSCSKNPIVSAEGVTLMENVPINQEISVITNVTDGKLSLNITAPDATLAINLAYIKIYNPEGVEAAVGTDGNGEAEEGSNILLYTVAAVCTVAVLIGIGFAVVKIKKNKKKSK